MSDIGPDLPPHLLERRKRKLEEAAEAASATASGAKRSPSQDGVEKRRRVLGPAMPPAPLDERPVEAAEPVEESDSDDDGFGPALPTAASQAEQSEENENTSGPSAPEPVPAEKKLKRDDWMTMPPKQDDLAARMDPSKQRARGFNTGKGAKAPPPSDDDSSAWFETAEQKQKRLADEVMGISKPSAIGPAKPGKKTDETIAKKVREHTEKTRGPSLFEQHQKTKGADADDDPSKRAFDREKDMGSGMRVGHAQRKEMVDKAGGFSSKFSGGSYL